MLPQICPYIISHTFRTASVCNLDTVKVVLIFPAPERFGTCYIYTNDNKYQENYLGNPMFDFKIGDLPRHSFLASHVSDTMCVDDGSSVPSYNFIKPANMWGSFKLTFEQ